MVKTKSKTSKTSKKSKKSKGTKIYYVSEKAWNFRSSSRSRAEACRRARAMRKKGKTVRVGVTVNSGLLGLKFSPGKQVNCFSASRKKCKLPTTKTKKRVVASFKSKRASRNSSVNKRLR